MTAENQFKLKDEDREALNNPDKTEQLKYLVILVKNIFAQALSSENLNNYIVKDYGGIKINESVLLDTIGEVRIQFDLLIQQIELLLTEDHDYNYTNSSIQSVEPAIPEELKDSRRTIYQTSTWFFARKYSDFIIPKEGAFQLITATIEPFTQEKGDPTIVNVIKFLLDYVDNLTEKSALNSKKGEFFRPTENATFTDEKRRSLIAKILNIPIRQVTIFSSHLTHDGKEPHFSPIIGIKVTMYHDRIKTQLILPISTFKDTELIAFEIPKEDTNANKFFYAFQEIVNIVEALPQPQKNKLKKR